MATFYTPTGQCSTFSAGIGKSSGLPVASGRSRNAALIRRAIEADRELLLMVYATRIARRHKRLPVAIAALLLVAPATAPARGRRVEPTGGAAVGGVAPTRHVKRKIPTAPRKKARSRWLRDVTITEYWPAPESWFVGGLVSAPGLTGMHRIDWLYSATGVSMQGEGIGLDGRIYHIAAPGNGGWVTAAGKRTSPGDGWSAGAPFWRAGAYWRNRRRAVTFPLALGGWSAGPPRKYVPLRGVSFAEGPSLPLRYYQSIAVDPREIPLGSRVFIPAYQHDGHGGWFIAQDTGGAIGSHHIDVFRPPPPSSSDSGQYLTAQRVLVIKPRT
jgi:3D (Asp-Asp-Asp) domain-containing protein